MVVITNVLGLGHVLNVVDHMAQVFEGFA